jgi:hypothetical protein
MAHLERKTRMSSNEIERMLWRVMFNDNSGGGMNLLRVMPDTPDEEKGADMSGEYMQRVPGGGSIRVDGYGRPVSSPQIYNGDHPGDWCIQLGRDDLANVRYWLGRMGMPQRHIPECNQMAQAMSHHGFPLLLTYKADGVFMARSVHATAMMTHNTGEPRPIIRLQGPDDAVDAATRAMTYMVTQPHTTAEQVRHALEAARRRDQAMVEREILTRLANGNEPIGDGEAERPKTFEPIFVDTTRLRAEMNGAVQDSAVPERMSMEDFVRSNTPARRHQEEDSYWRGQARFHDYQPNAIAGLVLTANPKELDDLWARTCIEDYKKSIEANKRAASTR